MSEAIAPEADTVAPGTQDQLAPASDSKSSILPREGSSADVPETAPATFAIQSPSLTLTAEEAGSLLDSYTLISESDGTLVYELTAAEYTALLQQLEQQGLAHCRRRHRRGGGGRRNHSGPRDSRLKKQKGRRNFLRRPSSLF